MLVEISACTGINSFFWRVLLARCMIILQAQNMICTCVVSDDTRKCCQSGGYSHIYDRDLGGQVLE